MADWDKRYREGFYNGATQPHSLLRRYQPAIPEGGTVIDIASGNGRDALFLAGKGYSAWGLDSSGEALKIARESADGAGLTLNLVQGDALALPFKKNSADGVMVFYFLERSIMKEIPHLLRNGGILIYETFLKRQNDVDRWRNPDFLLEDGELLSYFGDLDLLFYEETVTESGGRKKAVASYVGRKR